jgi:maltoporin
MRIGDTGTGTCSTHGAVSIVFTATSGNMTDTTNNKAVVRVGDTGIASCGATITATTGSSLVTNAGAAIHRVGDTGTISHGGTFTSTTSTTTFNVA